ncbi:MAG: GNAT family N-acetyltransferase [Planctomycetota bacterium]
MAAVVVRQVDADWVLPLRCAVLRGGRPPEETHFDGDRGDQTVHLAASAGDEVVGVVTLMREDRSETPTAAWRLRGMAVSPSWRGRGVGGRLLAEVRRRWEHDALWCHARTPARKFYERHGWVAVSDVFEIEHFGPHVTMVWPADAGGGGAADV